MGDERVKAQQELRPPMPSKRIDLIDAAKKKR